MYIQSKTTLQTISSIPKRPASDIYPTALPSYHQKNKDRLSIELNATDNLSHVKHHKRTNISKSINIYLSYLSPNHIFVDQPLSFFAFPLHSNIDSAHC
jgi:hypothetical protein